VLTMIWAYWIKWQTRGGPEPLFKMRALYPCFYKDRLLSISFGMERILLPNAKVSISLGTESAHCVSIVFLL
jgi:hypothetical protein